MYDTIKKVLERKMSGIVVETITLAPEGKPIITYVVGDKRFKRLWEAITEANITHKIVYEALGIPEYIYSEWHPKDNEFSTRCEGWEKFLQACPNGEYKPTTTTRELSVNEVLEDRETD